MRSLIRRAVRRNSTNPSRQLPHLSRKAVVPDVQPSVSPDAQNSARLDELKQLPSIQSNSSPPVEVLHRLEIDGTDGNKIQEPIKVQSVTEILVYGTPKSGVTTLLEEMVLLHEQNQLYDDMERETWREIIVSDLVTTMQKLLRDSRHRDDSSMESASQVVSTALVGIIGYRLTPLLAYSLWKLWQDGAIREKCRVEGLDD